jgi:hypothetical protein
MLLRHFVLNVLSLEKFRVAGEKTGGRGAKVVMEACGNGDSWQMGRRDFGFMERANGDPSPGSFTRSSFFAISITPFPAFRLRPRTHRSCTPKTGQKLDNLVGRFILASRLEYNL